jgi:hypothetical protein
MESLNLNTLANSLPNAHQNAEKDLLNNFKGKSQLFSRGFIFTNRFKLIKQKFPLISCCSEHHDTLPVIQTEL